MALNYRQFLDSLDMLRPSGQDKWTARCPAHDDRFLSLSIRLEKTSRGEETILIHCHAGCSPYSILDAVGMHWTDFFDSDIDGSYGAANR